MNITDYIDYHLAEIIEIARLAPSVHNTQPWVVKAIDKGIEITIDQNYALLDGDPTGRQTIISLGIFAEAVCIGAEHTGLKVKRVVFNARVAVIICVFSPKKIASDGQVLEMLKKRCTDRSIYQPTDITGSMVSGLEKIKKSRDITVHVVTDKNMLRIIAELTAKGIRLALSSPSFRKELSNYLVLPWSNKKRGIAVRSLYLPWILEVMEPIFMRSGIGLDAESKLEKQRWMSASAVVVITSKGDMPDYWFEVGRVYLQVSLAIESFGLSQATSASLVEASDFHEDIEGLLKTKQRIQSVLRIGTGSTHRMHSPRVGAEELIST